jgi:hypothetical protein
MNQFQEGTVDGGGDGGLRNAIRTLTFGVIGLVGRSVGYKVKEDH